MVARLIVQRDAAGSREDGIRVWVQRGWFRRREMMVSEKREGGFGGERGVGSRFRASSGHSRGRIDGVRGQGHTEGRGSTGIGRGIGDAGEGMVGGKLGEGGGTWSDGEKREVRR